MQKRRKDAKISQSMIATPILSKFGTELKHQTVITAKDAKFYIVNIQHGGGRHTEF